MDANKIRADFPALTQRVRGKKLIYLDSAATALKPWPVIERIGHFYTYETANVHRGAHYLADQATGNFEKTRELSRQFLNAAVTEEIIFTKGMTESANLVATSYGLKHVKAGDEILITEMEHHANIVPWQMLCERVGAKLKVAPITEGGEIKWDEFEKLVNSKTKIVAITHCSNVLGTINDVKKAAQIAHKHGAVIFVDGAQMVANAPVDVQNIDADFYSFSGHKLFGPYGVGVLYGKKQLLSQMTPYQGGGSMISEVTFEKTTYNELPFHFEAGTPNIEAVIALGSAIEYVQKVGFSQIEQIEKDIYQYAFEKLKEIPGVEIYGVADKKAPILSFNIKGLHAADVGQILDQEAIAVRTGHHCCQPLMKKLGITGCIRASFSIFNTRADVDALVAGLMKAKEMFQ